MGLEPHFKRAVNQPVAGPTSERPTGITWESIPVPWKGPRIKKRRESGVDDGTRTHDDRDHNPGLYQLSYAHHGFAHLTKSQAFWRARQDSNLQPSA